MSKEFSFSFKVYYEDTDAGGVVYYANYLKFLERARSDAIITSGITNTKLLNNFNVLIIVKSCNIEYLKPAKLEDNLIIYSKVTSNTKTSFVMKQTIKRQSEIISHAEVRLVCVNPKGKPVQIPNVIQNLIKS
mgnify:CR=1 FL=1